MSLPELVTIHTSLLTDLGDAIRERFDVSGDKTLPELTAIVKPIIPSGYTAVEYLESSGTQYIDTGLQPSASMIIKAKIKLATTNNGCFLGYQSERSKLNYCFGVQNGKYLVGLHNPYNELETSENADTDIHTIYFANGTQKIDNVEIATCSASDFTIYPTNQYIALFAARNNWGNAYGSVRFYDCYFFNNEALIHKFVPCIRQSDSVAGMYDIIGGQFYTNAGTGSFITP